MIWFAIGLLVQGGLVFGQSSNEGKTQGPPPTRPALSPYLNLARDNSGVLPSFQAFVLPRLELDQQKNKQLQLMMRANRMESAIQSDPGLRPTGQGGKFQNRLHFYPTQTNPKTNLR